MSFPYQMVHYSKSSLPLCTIYILVKNERIPVRVLVDSGATDTVLPLNVAIDAGFEIPERLTPQVQYGGSQANGVEINTYFEIGGRRLSADFKYVEKLEFPYGLLGRRGVFNKFNEVAFSERPKCPLVEFRW